MRRSTKCVCLFQKDDTLMNRCLRERGTDTEDDAFAITAADLIGGESGAVAENPFNGNVLLGGMNGALRNWRKRSGAAFLKCEIELFVEFSTLSAWTCLGAIGVTDTLVKREIGVSGLDAIFVCK